MPSEFAEDEVMAAVVLRPGCPLMPQELVEFLRPRLARFGIPRFVRFMPALPVTENGKVRKAALRDAGITTDTWDGENQQDLVPASIEPVPQPHKNKRSASLSLLRCDICHLRPRQTSYPSTPAPGIRSSIRLRYQVSLSDGRNLNSQKPVTNQATTVSGKGPT